MDIKFNIPDWIKIPLKILLPALWLFSGVATLLSDELLDKLFLLEWRNANGFAIGLTFLITSCLILVYVIYFILPLVKNLFLQLTRNRKTLKMLGKLSNAEMSIICMLYNSPNCTGRLDYNQPIVQGLIAQDLVFVGTQDAMRYIGTATKLIYATLQPYVWQSLDYGKIKIKKRIDRYTRILEKEKRSKRRQQIAEQLQELKEGYNRFYTGGNK